MQRACKLQHFTHGKQNTCLPIFNYLQAERATPSFVAENEAIDASSSSLEALIATLQMQRASKRQNFTHGKQNTCLPIFNYLQAERATRQRRPLLQLKTKRLMLPARRWKRLLQLYKCKGQANGRTLPTANRIRVCRSLIICKWRGRRGNVALFCS